MRKITVTQENVTRTLIEPRRKTVDVTLLASEWIVKKFID